MEEIDDECSEHQITSIIWGDDATPVLRRIQRDICYALRPPKIFEDLCGSRNFFETSDITRIIIYVAEYSRD